MQGIFELAPREELSAILQNFNAVIGLPIQLSAGDGRVLLSYGKATRYCQLLKKWLFAPGSCQRAHWDSGCRAQAIGEPYIFACRAQLNQIAFALTQKGVLLGTILVGPFLMDKPDSTLISALADQKPLPATALLELYDELESVPVVEPQRVREISRLLFYLLSPIIPGERQKLLMSQQKLYQQSRISETIQMFKAERQSDDRYPYELEKRLLQKVKAGDASAAKGVLNDLLGYVFFCEGGRMDTMKNRALELCTLLSRIAIEGGAVTGSIFRLNNQFLSSLQQIDTLEALCYQLQDIVEAFVDSTFSAAGAGHEAVKRAAGYIAAHYAEPIGLQDVANHVGLSPSYFSSLFRRTTGVDLRDYLNQTRVEESKRLLSNTDYSLVDIAVAMGFNDQSYFSKVFKKYTGLTPRQYR